MVSSLFPWWLPRLLAWIDFSLRHPIRGRPRAFNRDWICTQKDGVPPWEL